MTITHPCLSSLRTSTKPILVTRVSVLNGNEGIKLATIISETYPASVSPTLDSETLLRSHFRNRSHNGGLRDIRPGAAYCCQPRFQSIGQHHQNQILSLAKFGFRRFGSSCLSICTRMSVVSSFLQICFQQNDYTTSRLYCQTPFCTLASTEAIKQLYELK